MVSTPATCVALHRKEERCDVRGATRLEMVVEGGPAAAALYPYYVYASTQLSALVWLLVH